MIGFNTVEGEFSYQVIIERSKFICYLKGIENEDQAKEYINSIKKINSLANHNCYAYIADEQGLIMKFSDDCEPQGTAGLPMLEVLKNKRLYKTVAVVTRYFGGTLLGTGGLVRAYTDASKEALKNCETKLMQRLIPVDIKSNYTDMGKIQYILNTNSVNILDTEFTDEVVFKTEIPVIISDRIISEITEATGARAILDIKDEIFG